MPTNLITLDKTLVKKSIEFLKNPITSLVLGILISFFFYFISISYKSPSYYISKPELIAQKTDEKLKIQYDKLEINNIYSSSLFLWNDGEEYIDYQDFIKQKPVKLYSTDSIKILSASISGKSRTDLNFSTTISCDTINIFPLNDEALEEGDGVRILFLFTSNKIAKSNFNFNLESRIKGSKDGFKFRDLSNYNTKSDKKNIIIIWGIIIFFTLFRIIVLYLYKKPIVFRTVEVIFIFTLFIIGIYKTVIFIFYTTNLHWI